MENEKKITDHEEGVDRQLNEQSPESVGALLLRFLPPSCHSHASTLRFRAVVAQGESGSNFHCAKGECH
jgi:hypothetical protein